MQLRLDAADRLVELVEERRGPVAADEAARAVLKLGGPVATGLARSLLDEAVRPGARLQPAVAALTGLRDEQLRRAPPVAAVVRGFLAFAGDAVLVAHNARFDMAFLDNETMRLTGDRLVASVVDTVGLARRLLGRQPANLAALAHRFVTDAKPCHRALPDAEATAEILLRLIGMAQERGARTVADLIELAATRPRRVHMRRSLAFGAPQRPGVYLFSDRHDQVLYVGRARDLRARLRSYFRSERQRPAVEAALGALHRIEWRVLGSELEAGLEELRLIRELRPPANARSARPDRYTYLRRRGAGVVCSSQPTELGPLKSRRRTQAAARVLEGLEWESPGDAVPPLRAKLRRLARDQRYEDAARLRDRIDALDRVTQELARLERLRRLEVCVVAPGLDEGARTAFFVAKGQVVCARPLVACDTVSQATGGPEIAAGLAAVERAEPTLAPEAADELLLVASFLRRPPPELEVVTLAHLRRWTSFASGRAA